MSKIRVADIHFRDTGKAVSIRSVASIVSDNGLVSFVYPKDGQNREVTYPVDLIKFIEVYEEEA